MATSAAQLRDERLMGEALAIDGLACHFLTDAFSASHARTPRSSIEDYWDKKVPDFDEQARELARRRGHVRGHTQPQRHP